MTTGSSKDERECLPLGDPLIRHWRGGIDGGHLALKVEKRVNPATGFTHEG